jgi:lysophospholipid acyltransferase (LPLAT)-like uncharacterized protein
LINFKTVKNNIIHFLGIHLVYFLMNFLCRTLIITLKNEQPVKRFLETKTNFVLAFWHGTMLVPWFYHKRNNFAALVSKSKDGLLLTKVLEPWKYKVIRGSSNSGGKNALNILVDEAKKNHSIAITPDGPIGPSKQIKPGAIIIAKRSNIPLVLLGVGYKRKRELRSWDKFEIPKFFSRANLIYSDPIYIAPELNYDETNKIIKECEIILNNLQKEAMVFVN